MPIAVHDADKTRFPNLALMKLSAYHRAAGAKVEFWDPNKCYDKVFSSKVFTFTDCNDDLPEDTIRGGIGYGVMDALPPGVEHIMPDYDLYGLDYSLGFLTRGCTRKCSWCFVPEKEGYIKANADIEEFAKHDQVVLMDNNVLACSHGIEQIEKIARLGIKVDFNQGLDARLIDDGIARRLSKLKWMKPLRLACDSVTQIDSVTKAVQLLRWHNTTPSRYFCYVLVDDIQDALERIRVLKGLYVDPFAQPFIDAEGNDPTKEQKHFARWVNHKAEFKSRTWEEYAATKTF